MGATQWDRLVHHRHHRYGVDNDHGNTTTGTSSEGVSEDHKLQASAGSISTNYATSGGNLGLAEADIAMFALTSTAADVDTDMIDEGVIVPARQRSRGILSSMPNLINPNPAIPPVYAANFQYTIDESAKGAAIANQGRRARMSAAAACIATFLSWTPIPIVPPTVPDNAYLSQTLDTATTIRQYRGSFADIAEPGRTLTPFFAQIIPNQTLDAAASIRQYKASLTELARGLFPPAVAIPFKEADVSTLNVATGIRQYQGHFGDMPCLVNPNTPPPVTLVTIPQNQTLDAASAIQQYRASFGDIWIFHCHSSGFFSEIVDNPTLRTAAEIRQYQAAFGFIALPYNLPPVVVTVPVVLTQTLDLATTIRQYQASMGQFAFIGKPVVPIPIFVPSTQTLDAAANIRQYKAKFSDITPFLEFKVIPPFTGGIIGEVILSQMESNDEVASQMSSNDTILGGTI